MPQIKVHNAYISFGEQPVLDQASCTINKRQRIALIGRNGAGKSTFLQLLAGTIQPDSGSIEQASHLRVECMSQQVPQNLNGSVLSYVEKYHHSEHEWERYQVDTILSKLQLDPALQLDRASGGQIRRTLLAAALVNQPDVLLLDEPTNHLDIQSIEWLESFLLNYNNTIVFITHDRSFMQTLATDIFELDLGQLTCWHGDYRGFLQHKANQLNAEAQQQKLFDKKLSQEEAWIRQGIKARRTRNEGRVRQLKQLREQRAQRRERQGQLKLQQSKNEYAGKIVFELEQINIQYDQAPLIKDFSTTILRGDKVAIIGPNGCGKSSLLQVMLKHHKPLSGQVKLGSQLNVVYFDQHRAQLNLEASAIDNVGEGSLEIDVNGQKKHIIGYLQDFLFTPEKARSLVKTFSGGERNRLLLAKILAQPANVLVLDEPTNDLDMESLDVLEEYLIQFPGTLIMVSHDRSLLNHVATSCIVFEGDGQLQEYVGGYDDWQQQRTSRSSNDNHASKVTKPKQALSHDERKQLNKLPTLIEKLEHKISQLQQEMSANDFYQQHSREIDNKTQQLKKLETALQQAFERWEYLELKQQSEH